MDTVLFPRYSTLSDGHVHVRTTRLDSQQNDIRDTFTAGEFVRIHVHTPRRGYLTLVREGPDGIMLLAPAPPLTSASIVLPACRWYTIPDHNQQALPVGGTAGAYRMLALLTQSPFRVPASVRTCRPLTGMQLAHVRDLLGSSVVIGSSCYHVVTAAGTVGISRMSSM